MNNPISLQKDFLLPVNLDDDPDVETETGCDTLMMCIMTTLNQGLRAGGGIADILRPVSKTEPGFGSRWLYDMSFYFVMIVIVLNLILGIIIDTFADLRKEKQEKDELRRNTCFICGLDRSAFDRTDAGSFERHCRDEHSPWSYVNFLVLLKTKSPTEFTGPESYVHELICRDPPDLSWFPHLAAHSLVKETAADDADTMAELRGNLQDTAGVVRTLVEQLNTLQQNLVEQRKTTQRNDITAQRRIIQQQQQMEAMQNS